MTLDLSAHKPRTLDFATTRELLMYADRNPIRASYAALALLYPDALGLQAATVDSRYRQLGSLHELGGMVWERAVNKGIDEAQLSDAMTPVWADLMARQFPSADEVASEVGNS